MIQSQENCLFAITVKPTSDGEGGTNVNRYHLCIYSSPQILRGFFITNIQQVGGYDERDKV
jgi:hypothetical protein